MTPKRVRRDDTGNMAVVGIVAIVVVLVLVVAAVLIFGSLSGAPSISTCSLAVTVKTPSIAIFWASVSVQGQTQRTSMIGVASFSGLSCGPSVVTATTDHLSMPISTQSMSQLVVLVPGAANTATFVLT